MAIKLEGIPDAQFDFDAAYAEGGSSDSMAYPLIPLNTVEMGDDAAERGSL